MNRRAVFVLAILPLALAGCASNPVPALSTRSTLEDSMALLTVDSASEGLTYGEILVLVDNTPFKIGGHMDHAQHVFEVVGKDNPSDLVALGDVIRIPMSGKADVELRHAGGTSLQQLKLDVPDHTPPPAPVLNTPQKGANAVARAPVFQWETLDDPASLSYALEYWVSSQSVNAPHTLVANLVSASYALPAENQLLPGTTYHWHVRAIDGVGNVGLWSEDTEFVTAV